MLTKSELQSQRNKPRKPPVLTVGSVNKTIKEPSEVLPLTEPDYVEPTMGYGQPAQVAQPQIIVNNTATATVEGGFSAAPKSRMVALILCILFGIFGIHRFYVGKVGTGIIWMFSGF